MFCLLDLVITGKNAKDYSNIWPNKVKCQRSCTYGSSIKASYWSIMHFLLLYMYRVYKHRRKIFFILLNHFNPPMASDKLDWFQTSWGITFAILAMLALTELCTFFYFSIDKWHIFLKSIIFNRIMKTYYIF